MLKICSRCKVEFESATRKFCSRSCANSRPWTAENKQKISKSVKDTWTSKSDESKRKCREALGRGLETRQKKSRDHILSTPTENLGDGHRKRKVFEEQGCCCGRCGIKNWLEQPLSFEIDHIDGNSRNNVRGNLIVLCPNCHSQTPTWRGRNNRRKSMAV